MVRLVGALLVIGLTVGCDDSAPSPGGGDVPRPSPDISSCAPRSCADAQASCGAIDDGCGATLECGSCGEGQTCSAQHACIASCTPTTCADAGKNCGTMPDGCGGTLSCGTCAQGQTCGGGGSANVCGVQACTPTTCADQKKTCGDISDGCGSTLQCGTCGENQTCNDGQCTTADACQGLTPGTPGKPSASYELASDISYASEGCEVGTSDGHGNLVFPHGRSRSTSLDFVSSGGVKVGDDVHYSVTLTPQLNGFMGVHQWYTEGYSLVRYSPDGNRTTDERMAQRGQAMVAREPRGGVVVFEDDAKMLRSFDETGRQRWAVSIDADWLDAMAVDRQGNTLTIRENATTGIVSGQWVDAAGNVRPVFDISGLGFGHYALFPRVGSGLFLLKHASDGNGSTTWVRTFRALENSAEPAPEWLQSRPNTRLEMARGGKAYALLHPPLAGTETPCRETVELLAPTGESCGTATFGFEGTCQLRGLAVGYDGTVIQRMPQREEHCQSETVCRCGWRWWQGFLH